MSSGEQCILVVAGYAPSLVNFRGPLLKAIRGAGYRVIAAAPGLLEDRRTLAELGRLGVQCRDVPLRRTGLNPVADLRLAASLVRLMRAEKPAAFLGYTVKPVIFGLIAAAIAAVPRRYALITGLGYAFADRMDLKTRLVRAVQERLYWIALRCATNAFFQNRDDPELFRRLRLLPAGLPVIIVAGSGIDLERFGHAPLPDGPVRFLLIARLIAAKGICEYAQAARLVRERHPDVEFHLIGGLDNNPDALSADEVLEWRSNGTLIWHGEVEDVRPHLAGCHVYVLPSCHREGTPRSVLEALAVGRAVITTDVPGCRETVTDGQNGFLVPPRDFVRLAEAMNHFVEVPSLIASMGRRSRALAERKFDVNKVNARMLREMEL